MVSVIDLAVRTVLEPARALSVQTAASLFVQQSVRKGIPLLKHMSAMLLVMALQSRGMGEDQVHAIVIYEGDQ